MARVGMRLSFWAMMAWVVFVPLVVGAAAAWPTHRLCGAEGLRAQAAAAAIVMPVMLVSALLVVLVAPYGPAAAAAAFMAVGAVRAMIVLFAGIIVWRFWHLSGMVLGIWVGLFYLVTLVCGAFWLAHALQQDAFLVALGKINRSPPPRQRKGLAASP